MKKTVFLGILIAALIGSCKKTTDLTTGWAGSYAVAGNADTVNQVTVSKVNDNTVAMAIQISYNGGTTFNTTTTLSDVSLANSSNGSFDQYGLIAGSPDTYRMTGTALLNGNDLTVTATYTDTTTHIARPYYFIGSK